MSSNKTTVQETHVREVHSNTGTGADVHVDDKKKTGVLHDIKEGVKNLADKITGNKDEHKHDTTCNKSTCHTYESATAHYTETDEHARNARLLREQGEAALRNNAKEFSEAERAQAQARVVAEHANAKTAQALNNQERGQELIAEAGK